MKQWQEFGARQSNVIAQDNFICAADELGLILVNGADAHEFLQHQLSHDIDLIDENRMQLNSYSTPKGRLLGIFWLVKISNGYILVTAKSMVLPLLERLYKYIVGAQVTLADASDYFARIAIQTDTAAVIADARLPTKDRAVLQNDSIISLRLDASGQQQRFLLLCLSANEAIELWHEFAALLPAANFTSWRLADIKAGLPSIYPQTAEEFVLQMANLGVLDAVSFKKGCYPGQEIVARMQYLGKLKRRMFLAQLETKQLPLPGDKLVVLGKTEVDGSGMVVDAAYDAQGLCHCLYIAQIAKAESGNLGLLDQPETRIINKELPYSVEV